jgi:hypothetical protein
MQLNIVTQKILSSVSIVNTLRNGRPRSDSRKGLEIFLFATAPKLALGPIQPPIQWIPGALSPGVKRPVRVAEHLPTSNVQVKNA